MKLVLFALIFLSSAVSSNCEIVEIVYLPNELAALQAIFKDWNQSTPSVSTNLPGWLFNSNQTAYPCFYDAWKGVLCVQYPIANSTNRWSIVVGLSLDDASIVGTLPPAIGSLTNLVILSLTNNPGLTGPIPAEINNCTVLQILDLHNNNFNGTIPEFTNLGSLQKL
jgi:Leucine-rich repeat (LRR) protein